LDRRLGGPCGVEKGSKPFSVCGALNVMMRFAGSHEKAILYALFRNRNSITSEIFDVILLHDLL
jgi:hypothetical protein